MIIIERLEVLTRMETGDIVLQKYYFFSWSFSRMMCNCFIMAVHPAVLCGNPYKIFGALLLFLDVLLFFFSLKM